MRTRARLCSYHAIFLLRCAVLAYALVSEQQAGVPRTLRVGQSLAQRAIYVCAHARKRARWVSTGVCMIMMCARRQASGMRWRVHAQQRQMRARFVVEDGAAPVAACARTPQVLDVFVLVAQAWPASGAAHRRAATRCALGMTTRRVLVIRRVSFIFCPKNLFRGEA